MTIGKTHPSLVKLSWDNQSLFQTNQWNWFVHLDLQRKTGFQMSQHLSLDRPFDIEVVLDSRLGYFNSVTKSFHFIWLIMPAFYLGIQDLNFKFNDGNKTWSFTFTFFMSLVLQGPDIIVRVPEVLSYLHMHHRKESKVYSRWSIFFYRFTVSDEHVIVIHVNAEIIFDSHSNLFPPCLPLG